MNMMDMRPKYKMRFVGYDANGELKPTAPAYKQHEIRELPLEYAQNFWWELVDAVPDLVIPEPRYEDSVFIEEVFVPPDDEAPAPPLEDEDKPLSLKEESDPNLAEDEEWDTSEFITSHSDNLGAMPTSEAVEPGEAFVVAPDAIDESGEVDLGKVVKIEGLEEKPFDSHSGELGDTLTVEMAHPAIITEEQAKYLDKSIYNADVKVYPETELEGIPYEKMTVKSLKLFIKQRGGEVDSSWRKADLIREARRLEELSSPT